jgi:hypothetical protein
MVVLRMLHKWMEKHLERPFYAIEMERAGILLEEARPAGNVARGKRHKKVVPLRVTK